MSDIWTAQHIFYVISIPYFLSCNCRIVQQWINTDCRWKRFVVICWVSLSAFTVTCTT